jgi:hypothetical protein
MTYGLTYTATAPIEVYEAIHAEVLREQGDRPARGLLVHFARPTATGFQLTEIWETREDLEAYNREVVDPVMQRLSAAGGAAPPPPAVEEFEVHGLLLPTAVR